MLTEDQINEAGLLAIEAEYGTAKKDMLPFSAEIESASGYGRGFCKGAIWAQSVKPVLSKRIERILDRIFLVLSWLGTIALWLLVFALFAMLLTKGSMTVTLGYGE